MRTPRLAALVLAAGSGSRLGGGKLCLAWKEKSILAHVLSVAERALCLAPLVCVVGHEWGTACRTLAEAGIRTATQGGDAALHPGQPFWHMEINHQWAEGQSTSLHAGITRLKRLSAEGDLDGVMVFLGDQPLVRCETVRLLAHSHACPLPGRHGLAPPLATAPVCRGRRGNPVVLGKDLFPALENINGDTGARALLQSLGPRLNLVEVQDAGVLFDVDTPEAYAALLRGTPHV